MEPGMGSPESVIELGKQKKSKAPIVAAICAVLAVVGIGFGVFEIMQNKGKNIDDLKIEIENSDGTKTELETDKIIISDDKSKITIKNSVKAGDYTIYYSLIDRYVSGIAPFDSNTVKKALEGDFDNADYIALVVLGSRSMETSSIYRGALDEGAKKYFGKDSFGYNEYQLSCVDYRLEGDSYVSYAGGCGFVGAADTDYVIREVKENGDVLEITVSYTAMTVNPMELYGDGSNTNFKLSIAGNAYEKEFSKDEVNDDINKVIEIGKKYFEEHLDEFDKYTLTFKKEDRHYYLTGSSKAE